MKTYQITFEWPNGDWTWIDVVVNDFQDAIGAAIANLPISCRIRSITAIRNSKE